MTFEVKTGGEKKKCGKGGGASGTKQIIKEASGCALPGETLFIMGSSGAGKTSLLNILSDRVSTSNG